MIDGRGIEIDVRVTTHWRFAADVAKRFPKLRMEPNASLRVIVSIEITLRGVYNEIALKRLLKYWSGSRVEAEGRMARSE